MIEYDSIELYTPLMINPSVLKTNQREKLELNFELAKKSSSHIFPFDRHRLYVTWAARHLISNKIGFFFFLREKYKSNQGLKSKENAPSHLLKCTIKNLGKKIGNLHVENTCTCNQW